MNVSFWLADLFACSDNQPELLFGQEQKLYFSFRNRFLTGKSEFT